MNRLLTLLLAGACTLGGGAALKGFHYGNATAPGGHEWQSPDSVAYNKEQPRAWFFSFADKESAKKVLPENSKYFLSLDGQWKFNWVNTPEKRPVGFQNPSYDVSGWDNIPVPSNWNIVGLQKDGTMKYGKPIYVNQPVIFQHSVRVDDWRGGVMRTPPENWTTYEDRNEVGSYRRTFEIPASWNGREIYIEFDGVDSFFYLWINGKYIGFSKNSRNTARFDITPYVKKGENTVAVEVYRNSDGSFLETQDMFRLPGIFRSVSLTSTPKLQVRDLVVFPDLTDNYRNGVLDITADVRNLSAKAAKGCRMVYSLYETPLFSDETSAKPVATATSSAFGVGMKDTGIVKTTLKLDDVRKWSAEEPWRYVLVAELTDSKGKPIETVSTYIGFRKIEILDTPADKDEFGKAGRYMYVNGKPVKFKGVNRHETNPEVGHALTRQHMEADVMAMRRGNINHVRGCHYPDAPYWYYLADKYGIMLEDEANIESHVYYYGNASLSHVPEFEAAHVARDMEMVHSDVNHPSIMIWSLGNEAGPGINFEKCYAAIKAFDTSRPIQYERNNDIVDIGSNQYPSIAWVEWAATGEADCKYPFHISEYAHSMGNALGGLQEYWDAIESSNFVMGGAIWDWVDQSLYAYDPETGDKFLAFGGDFGDFPAHGQFVMNGVMFGDLTPKPEYAEVKKVYQNVGVKNGADKHKIEVFNKNYFAPLEGYDVKWTLLKDGVPVENGTIDLPPVAPRSTAVAALPFKTVLDPTSEYFANIEFLLAQDMPWAGKGYVQMAEQLPIQEKAIVTETVAAVPFGEVKTENGKLTVSGEGYNIVFNTNEGTLESLEYDGTPVIIPGQGPRLDAFRAYLNNDEWIAGEWFKRGLYNLNHKVTDFQVLSNKKGCPVISFEIESQAPRGGKMVGGNGNPRGIYTIAENDTVNFGPNDFKFLSKQNWTVEKDGSLLLDAEIFSNEENVILPRLGFEMQVPKEFDTFTWYGRGPGENYSDRKTADFIGLYSMPVEETCVLYTRPQSNGNHEDVRWASLTKNGKGLRIDAPQTMSATAIPYTEMELFLADHPYKLPKSNRTVVHMDLGVTGLGGASCGQGGPREPQRVRAGLHNFSLKFSPVK